MTNTVYFISCACTLKYISCECRAALRYVHNKTGACDLDRCRGMSVTNEIVIDKNTNFVHECHSHVRNRAIDDVIRFLMNHATISYDSVQVTFSTDGEDHFLVDR